MEKRNYRWLGACAIWLMLLFIAVVCYKVWWKPKKEQEQQQQAVNEYKDTIDKTSSQSRYTSSVNFAIDAFSGYAPLRSDFFKEEAAKYGIRVDFKDDGANYKKRLEGLRDGTLDMGVFTIDALIKCSAEMDDLPATIVALIDESKGADAMVAAGKKFPNIDSLNNPNTRIVCVGDSPSETLARVLMAHFNLDRMAPQPFDLKNNADEVYKIYQQSKPDEQRVFVLWEPYVSKVIDNPDYHVLVDSSKFRGYVMDVIVARRGFLLKNSDKVEQLVKAYLTTIFAQRNDMIDMVWNDAKMSGDPLKKEQAEKLCRTIWWKNTQETFTHFGLLPNSNLQHLEEIIRNITVVLKKTGAINKDPSQGQPNKFYFDGIVKKLYDNNWHPGFGNESIRQEKSLLTLTDAEWLKLKPVGTLQVPRLVFARGTSKLTEASEATLIELTEKLKSWPQYYLVVRGNAASDGDLEANLKLATQRANTATQWLVEHGIDRNRIRSESAKPNGSTTVLFILCEQPY